MDQLLDVQIGALRIVGVPDTGLYVDNAVIGSVKAREGLDAAFAAARPGDTLVILSLEFLGRSTAETMMTIHRVNQATLHLWILDPQLHTASVQGRMFIETVELLEAAKRRRHRSWSKRAIMDEVFEGRFTLQKTIVSRAKLREGGRLLLSGITPEAVAKILSISSVTVRKHRQSMLDLATTDTGSLYISK
jgi:DNA invertase Pin-like site-specific DNA recombinase